MNAEGLRPIGSIIVVEFPPHLTSTELCSAHGHFWRYRVTGYEKVEPAWPGGPDMGEVLEPLERLCKKEDFGTYGGVETLPPKEG